VELVLVATVGILPSVVGSLLTLFEPEVTRRRLEAIGAFQISVNRFLQSATAITVAALVALYQPDGLASIGLHLGRGDTIGDAIFDSLLILGIVSGAGLVVAILIRLVGRPKEGPEVEPELPLEFSYLKTAWDRVLYASVMPFSAIGEEMIYRGYLVWLFVVRTGDYLPWIVLSIGLTIIIHLYQGLRIRLILFHSAFAGLMIWLTLYMGGIEGPIAIHILLNTVIFIRSWRAADKSKTEAGAEARSAADAPRGIRRVGYIAFIGLNLLILTSLCCSLLLILP
jgi:membrane protease YdiL (CAAX protease family)